LAASDKSFVFFFCVQHYFKQETMKKMMYRRIILCLLILCGLLVVSGAGYNPKQPVRALSDNLLVNGNFDELPFQWFDPNHFVPEGWDRWWIHGTVLPEYDDVNKPGGVREHIKVDGEHALVYFKWGNAYTAGVFQVVDGLTPCRPYALTMHARTHSLPGALPGARIGLDPWGEELTDDGAVHPPAEVRLHRTIWSREQTALFTWEQLAVTAEPLGTRLTAILYAAPSPGSHETHYYDTFWDAGALRAGAYANGRLPGPTQPTTNFIQNVNAITATTSATIHWNLSEGGGAQVWYKVVPPPTPPAPITSTFQISFSTYLPLVSRGIPFDFPQQTALEYTPGAARSATIANIPAGHSVYYIVVARRLRNGACVTEYDGPYGVTLP
jgi:hypothetical protein